MAEKIADTPLGYYTLTISNIKTVVAGVKIFTFDQDASNTFSYEAGQYLTLVHKRTQGEVRRSYSITSSPVLKEPLAIGVKRLENGFFSRRLVDHAKVGDRILTTGAAGLFTLPPNTAEYKQVFFLAAGSGITPIYSLLKTALYAHKTLFAVLLFSNNSPERTMFLEPLKQLAADFPSRLHIEFIFSNSPALSRARLHKDLLITLLNMLSIGDYRQGLFYICGPINYMRLISFALRQQKVPADNIRKEIFNIVETVPPKLTPPDTDAHSVILHLKDNTFQVESQYPVNILNCARKAGVSIPYSCETGKCGSCIARVLKGNVWMSNNEVLTDKDISKGLILTCVGFPVGGDVEIRIL